MKREPCDFFGNFDGHRCKFNYCILNSHTDFKISESLSDELKNIRGKA